MPYQEIIKELREILKVYHYKSDIEHMSKDAATSLENLLGTILKGSKTEDKDKYSLSEISDAWYKSYGEYLQNDYKGFLKLLIKEKEWNHARPKNNRPNRSRSSHT